MATARSVYLSVIVSVVMLAGQVAVNPARAEMIRQLVTRLSGTVNPITYTDTQGTFTTGLITLTLNPTSQSFFTIDLSTFEITAHTVIDVFFNNGKPGLDNEDLFGNLVVDESGMIGFIDNNGLIGPQPVLLDISNAILTDAGPFSGTTASGKNPVYNPETERYEWRIIRFGQPPSSLVMLNLPPSFIGGTNIPIESTIVATVVTISEPCTFTLFSIGILGLLSQVRWIKAKRCPPQV